MTSAVAGPGWRLPGALRRRRPWLFDTGLALALLVSGLLLGHEVPPPGWRPMDAPGYGLTCLAILPVVARRRAPLPVFLCCCAVWTVYISAGYWPVVEVGGPFLALYTVGARRGGRGALAAAALMGCVWVYSGLANSHSDMWAVWAQALVVPAAVTAFGLQAGRLDDRNRQLVALTARLAREQAARTEHAVTQERLRIARELHDVVAHHLSVVAVQAGLAGYVFDADPATARESLATIAGSSTEALEEMRNLLQLLRVGPLTEDGEEPLRPAPGLAQLDELVGRVSATGARTELVVTGEARALPPGVELCAYRIVQEALTNVLKHAGATRVTVLLDYGPVWLTGRIRDEGPDGSGVRAAVPGSGNGLIGMRERARLYGGTLRAGPGRDRGFEVVFTLPSSPQAGR